MDLERKAALRASTLVARRAMGAGDRQTASEAIVRRLESLPELRRAGVVLLYAAHAEEPDVGHLVAPLRRRGAVTVFPRVRGRALELVATSDLRTLQLGYRGIREPVGSPVAPDTVDLVIVPGVAFDPHGGRLGQGGGHYDRLLPTLRSETSRIGVCFACQFVPVVPREAHDAPVDVVITERATHRTRARA